MTKPISFDLAISNGDPAIGSKFTNRPMLFVIGVNHNSAPLRTREALSINKAEAVRLHGLLSETLDENLVLSTCNRTEIYGVIKSRRPDLAHYQELLTNFKAAQRVVKKEHFYGYVEKPAIHHLLRVAASIDSNIVGDSQILGQLRRSYEAAKGLGNTGKILNRLFQHAFAAGKKVRTETEIHKGSVSVSLAAVEFAARFFGTLDAKTALIIGAGETARLTANHLSKRKIGKMIFANRTRPRAEFLASSFTETLRTAPAVVDLDDLKPPLNDADIVITATSSAQPILDISHFADRKRPVLAIDISMPRNIAPEIAECPNVSLRNIGELCEIAEKNYSRRLAEMPRVNQIVIEELEELWSWYQTIPYQDLYFGQRDTARARYAANGVPNLPIWSFA